VHPVGSYYTNKSRCTVHKTLNLSERDEIFALLGCNAEYSRLHKIVVSPQQQIYVTLTFSRREQQQHFSTIRRGYRTMPPDVHGIGGGGVEDTSCHSPYAKKVKTIQNIAFGRRRSYRYALQHLEHTVKVK